MSRRAKPAKAKSKAKRPVARKSPENEGSRIRALEKRLAEALGQLEASNRELAEAHEQQTATSEILRGISQSRTDAQPVFDAIVQSAVRLCEGVQGTMVRFDGELVHWMASFNIAGDVETLRRFYPRPPGREGALTRAVLDRAMVHVPDTLRDPEYSRELLQVAGGRAVLAVPMVGNGQPIGAIAVVRRDPRPFSNNQIALLTTFADQAVIAIENVRLFKELEARNAALTQSLDQQTATGEVLRVISSVHTDAQPVFDTIVQSAARLCNAAQAAVFLTDGQMVYHPANYGGDPDQLAAMRARYPRPLDMTTATGVAIMTRSVVQMPDVEDPTALEFQRQAGRLLGFRSVLTVPMLRAEEAIGAVAVTRREPGRFSDAEVGLLKTFADQAVIAIDNAQLFKDLQERTAQLGRSVDELTALSQVGQALSSTLDIETVLTTIVSRAIELSRADGGSVYEYDDAAEEFRLRATQNFEEDLVEASRAMPLHGGGGALGMLAERREPVQIADISDPAVYRSAVRDLLLRIGYRALLAVPLLREQRLIGALVIGRKAPGEFPPGVVDLLTTFANQSALAIQNARLFLEIADKSRALEKLSRNQEQLFRLSTALQEPLSLTEQLTRVLDAARKVVGLDHLYIWTPSPTGDGLMVSAGAGLTETDSQALAGVTIPFAEAGVLAAVYREGQPRLFDETNPVPERYRLRPPYSTIAALRLKAFVLSPMIARGRTVGVLSADNRTRRTPIPAHTGDLLNSFAAQAAVAVENARLFQEIQEKGQELEAASQHKSEFLANMSHELRTPLNAIIGFSEVLSERMFGEVNEKQEEYLKDIHASGQHLLSLINDILDLSKIEAGRMELELTDFHLPATIDNALTLVRERAGRRGVALHQTVDERLGEIRGDERKLKQVVLNLLSNALKFTPEGGRIDVRAALVDGLVEISVADTGVGIAPEDQEAIFEEFRQVGTAAKQVEGTGLGLALSRKFIELHGGRIWVESQVGAGSRFTVTIPVRRGA